MAEPVKFLAEQFGADSFVFGMKNPRGKIAVELVNHLAFVNHRFALAQFARRVFQVKLHVVRWMQFATELVAEVAKQFVLTTNSADDVRNLPANEIPSRRTFCGEKRRNISML